MSPGALTLGRLLVGSLVLGAVLAVRGFRRPARRDWPLLLVCGLLWFGVYNIALNAAEQRVDAGTTAMLVNVGPLILALLAGVLLGEGFPRQLVTGSLVAFAGVVRDRRRHLRARAPGRPASLLCLVAAVGYAVGVVAQKPLLARLPALEVTWLACTIGAVACLPFAPQLVEEAGDARRLDPRLGRLPRRVPHRDRVHHLGLRPVAHDRRPDGGDHLPGAAGHDRAGLGAAGRDAGRARLRRRRPVPRRRRRSPGVPGRTVVAVRTPSDGASIARLAGLLADPTRAGMCLALLDGRAWTAGELATATGVARSTASEHLDQLVAGGLLAEERQGRHRYLRLAAPAAAQLVESLAVQAGPGTAPRSLRAVTAGEALARGRTCYDHLAGRLGVAVHGRAGRPRPGLRTPARDRPHRRRRAVAARPRRRRRLRCARARRPLVRTCLDWTERRPHLAGAAGAALCTPADGQRLGRAHAPAARCG